jgi:membrane associated rhomboid family serine protease
VTYILILLCLLVGYLSWGVDSRPVEEYLVYSGERLQEGALWTPVTTLFVHLDLTHLLGNLVFLFVFGRAVEEETGAGPTLMVFLVGGVGSLLISSFYYGFETALIGASGAIFTLAAAAMLMKPLKSSVLFLFIPLGLVASLYFLFNIIAIRLELPGNIGYMAHVLGFLIGVPFGIVLSKGEWLKNLIITLLLLIVFLAVISMVNNLVFLM